MLSALVTFLKSQANPCFSRDYNLEILFILNIIIKVFSVLRFKNLIYFDKVLAIDENNVVVLVSKGVALLRMGKYEEAIIYFDKVLAIDENNVIALRNKELAYDGT